MANRRTALIAGVFVVVVIAAVAAGALLSRGPTGNALTAVPGRASAGRSSLVVHPAGSSSTEIRDAKPIPEIASAGGTGASQLKWYLVRSSVHQLVVAVSPVCSHIAGAHVTYTQAAVTVTVFGQPVQQCTMHSGSQPPDLLRKIALKQPLDGRAISGKSN